MTKSPKNPRQREHQANERTFLAWMRTSISLIGFGLAIARFGLFLQQSQAGNSSESLQATLLFDSHHLGLSLIVVGIIIIALAGYRYNQVYWQIEHLSYRPNRFLIWIVTGLIILLGTLSLPIVWGGKKSSTKAKPAKHVLPMLPK